jgi:hypothetical protein
MSVEMFLPCETLLTALMLTMEPGHVLCTHFDARCGGIRSSWMRLFRASQFKIRHNQSKEKKIPGVGMREPGLSYFAWMHISFNIGHITL